jgi:hypothetical protein
MNIDFAFARVRYKQRPIPASPESVLRAMPDLLLEVVACRKRWLVSGKR